LAVAAWVAARESILDFGQRCKRILRGAGRTEEFER